MGGHKKTPPQDNFCENDSPFSLTEEVYQSARDFFCNNESHELLQLPRLLYTLNFIDHVVNIKNMLLRQAALMRGSILENYLYHSTERK